MEAVTLYILIGAGLLIVSILTSFIAFRVGAPLLLVFLGVGLAAGENGIGGIAFNDPQAAFLVGSIALAVILFESGLDTRFHSYRIAAGPAVTLATVGVLITTGVVGAAAHLLVGLSWPEALLIGAVLSSTDAAAVFFLLRVGGITIRDRVRSTLEIESGTNDPMAIFLTIALVEVISGGHYGVADFIGEFALQMGGGIILGLLGGAFITLVINRMRLEPALYPVVSLAFALFGFAFAGVVGASGFLAVYVAGLVAGNVRLRGAESLKRFHAGLTWLAQIVMFVLLGLLATPAHFVPLIPVAVALAMVLTLLARPLAVWLCLLPFRYSTRETAFVAWVGLRGAVSMLLAIVPLLAGVPSGSSVFIIAFLVVVVSLTVQGWTIRPMARRLGLIVPPRTGPVDRMELELPGEATMELVAYTVRADSPVARGHPLPRWARPSLVIRQGRVPPPSQARPLRPGDHVYLFTPPSRVPLLDRLYGGSRPLASDDREFYGDLVLNPDVTAQVVAEMYGLPVPLSDAPLTVAQLFERDYHDAYGIGDRIRLGAVELIVREVDIDGAIVSVGLALDPPRPTRLKLPSLLPVRAVGDAWRRLSRRHSSRREKQPGD
ncbi:MAG TPA: potassium/proton antiporter [Azospirillaceae bacterium]|nr:potassium/proton antiporter [Azospirillaceae bacterium]